MQSANAAVSEEMAAAYRASLNHLIRRSSSRLAGTQVVHWYSGRVPDEDDILGLASTSGAEADARRRARELLAALDKGERPDLAGCRYYVLTLSGASGRVMVRDWFEGPFPELVGSINAWFDDLDIVRRDGNGMAPPPKMLAVLGGLVRDLKELTAPTEARMWRVAVRCEPIPEQFLAQALGRVRSDVLQDQPARHARLGLLRAFHVRQGDTQMQPSLNPEHSAPAYHCGRLLAVLARLQRSALGDVGAGVIQRYYAAASATPGLVLGRLVRGSQFHLNKLDRGLAVWYENQLAEIFSRLAGDIPDTLDLREQSLFALGYYQQIAHDRAPKAGAEPGSADSADSDNPDQE